MAAFICGVRCSQKLFFNYIQFAHSSSMRLITIYNKRDWDLDGFVLFHQSWGFQGGYCQDRLAVSLGSFGEKPQRSFRIVTLKRKKEGREAERGKKHR